MCLTETESIAEQKRTSPPGDVAQCETRHNDAFVLNGDLTGKFAKSLV